MNHAVTFATLIAATAAAAPLVAQQDCRHEARRTATLNASVQDRLELTARAGSLRVIGRQGLSEVRVSGRACASSEDLLEDLQLETRRDGSTVHVEVAEIDHGWFSWGERYQYMDLEIEVPAGMDAEISDGSGASWLEGLGDVELDDGSGAIEMHDIAGDVTIDDGSGSILLNRIAGDVDIDDGSGELRIDGVTGSITVSDGSGEIEVRNVEGFVRITDGSGEIDVRSVRGDFTVERDGSGEIVFEDIGGRVDVPERRRRDRI